MPASLTEEELARLEAFTRIDYVKAAGVVSVPIADLLFCIASARAVRSVERVLDAMTEDVEMLEGGTASNRAFAHDLYGWIEKLQDALAPTATAEPTDGEER